LFDELPEEHIAFAGVKIQNVDAFLSRCSIDSSELGARNIDRPSPESWQFAIIEPPQERIAFGGVKIQKFVAFLSWCSLYFSELLEANIDRPSSKCWQLIHRSCPLG